MTYWLWSVPPDLYPAVVRTRTFALRQQGRKRLDEVWGTAVTRARGWARERLCAPHLTRTGLRLHDLREPTT